MVLNLTRVILPPNGLLTLSGNSFCFVMTAKGCNGHLVGRGQGFCSPSGGGDNNGGDNNGGGELEG